MIKVTENNLDLVEKNLTKRFKPFDFKKFKEITRDFFECRKNMEQLQHKKNQISKIKNMDKTQKEEAKNNKELLKANGLKLKLLEENFFNLSSELPNFCHESVPFGQNYDDFKLIKQWGNLFLAPLYHQDMNIFFDGSEFIGSKFIILKNKVAQIERALINFMMDSLNKNNFQEISGPVIMNSQGFKNSNHFPKEKENMFHISNTDKYLIPTSEALLLNIGFKKIWDSNEYFSMVSDCFRKEAGSSNQQDKGLIRVHQFKKCEMFVFAQPKDSYKILDEILEIPLKILQSLEIPFRVILLSSGDMPFNATKTYDIEIPIGGKWREVSSVSNCETMQTYNIKCKNSSGELLHTLNGSSLALGRTLASLLEIHYDKNSHSIKIPEVLHKYLDFTSISLN